jgi:D-serine deaminase-like pyridoxal phosphate-dependent protein
LFLLRGYGSVAGRPDLSVAALSEEHGWLDCDPGGPPLRVGETLRIIPNHACAAVANFARMHLMEDDRVVGRVPIGARGFAGAEPLEASR